MATGSPEALESALKGYLKLAKGAPIIFRTRDMYALATARDIKGLRQTSRIEEIEASGLGAINCCDGTLIVPGTTKDVIERSGPTGGLATLLQQGFELPGDAICNVLREITATIAESKRKPRGNTPLVLIGSSLYCSILAWLIDRYYLNIDLEGAPEFLSRMRIKQIEALLALEQKALLLEYLAALVLATHCVTRVYSSLFAVRLWPLEAFLVSKKGIEVLCYKKQEKKH